MLQRTILAVCAAMLVLQVGVAHGALTKDQFKCQKTVAKQGRVFFKKRFKALAKCNNAINKGNLPLSTDCTLEPVAMGKIGKAETKLGEKIGIACTDAVVASLDFGGGCAGVTTVAALSACVQSEHEAGSDTLIALVYGEPAPSDICVGGNNEGNLCTVDAQCTSGGGSCQPYESERLCVDGANDGDPCTDDGDCPGGACVLNDEQQKCTEVLAKVLGKLADKRQKIIQKCKKKVAKDKLPLSTDCVAAGQEKLDDEFAKVSTAITDECPQAVTETLALGGACASQDVPASITACGTCTVAKQADALTLVQHGSSARGSSAVAMQITDTADCVGGRQSRCRANDYLLANDRIRVVIQDLQRNLFGIGQYGGQIIDADIVRQGADPDRDNFEEWAVAINIENTTHYTSITVLNDGSNGGPAIIRATGVDDLLDFVNPSSTVASFGFALPASADDVNLPVTITTDYILEPGTNYVRVETTVENFDAGVTSIFFGEYINGSGEIEMFQTGYGFGEPLVASTCPVTNINLCNYTAYMGIDGGDGVSYGYVSQNPGSSTFTTSGVHVPQLSVEIILALVGLASPPFVLQPMGDPADSMLFTRYFVVGDGDVSDISDARNEIQCLPTGTLEGNVTAGGNPAVRADIAVLGNPADGPIFDPLDYNVLTHTRTDDQGNYSLTLPAGSYNVIANLEGSPYEGTLSAPTQHAVVVAAFGSTTQDIALPATGALQVTVDDENGYDVPARVTVVGFDPSADPRNTQNILGVVNNNTGIFRDRSREGLPHGIAKVLYLGVDGASGVVPIEPASYQVVVSRGPEYSIDKTNIGVVAGSTAGVMAVVERVIDSTGFVASDFHVHSVDSPDSRVPNADRVLTMIDESMEFFAATDHDIRFDYQTTIDAMGATSLLGTAVGEEITTFDYGHFNSWPLTTDPSQVNNGAIDFGGAAPDGMDFPSDGSFTETPADIIAMAHADAPGSENTVQVNHIHSHFGLEGGSGLAIDTALEPPESTVPPEARRLDTGMSDFFTGTFDALEIWIGDDRGQIYNRFLGENAGDWFNLINQGIVRTGIADSDSHTRIHNAGFPRSMVASPSDDPGDLSGLADTLSVNVNDGRSFGTNGPMVRITVEAASTGDEGGLELTKPTTIATTDGEVDITVDIQSPEWIQFDTVEYYINTTTTQFVLQDQEVGFGPPLDINRYSINPDVVQTAPGDFVINSVPVAGTSSNRLEATSTLSLTGLTEDIWVVVMVKGTDGNSEPLFPVLPGNLKRCTTVSQSCAVANFNTTLADLTDGNLDELGITALAFTNPIFVDVDGGGWTPPGVQLTP